MALIVSLSVILPVAALALAGLGWALLRKSSGKGGIMWGRSPSSKKRSRAPEVGEDTTLVVSRLGRGCCKVL